MQSATDIASELDEGLKQLFDAGLELSLQVQANAMAAEPAEQAKLAITFHRLSRGVRQTAALRMKLAREAERSGREASAEIIKLEDRRLQKRRAQVTAGVQSLIWVEAEDDDSRTVLEFELDELLDIEAQDPDTFEAEDLEAQVTRFARKLRLNPPTTVIPRSGGTPDPGDPSGVAIREPQLGSPASPCGRAEDDDGRGDYWRSSG